MLSNPANNSRRTKVAVLIEVANISSAFEDVRRTKNFPFSYKLDYKNLVNAITLGSDVIEKTAYLGVKKEMDPGQERFLGYFASSNFRLVTKTFKEISGPNGSIKRKANFDVEIAVDASKLIWRRDCDEIIIVSGDSDFAYLVDTARELDFKIAVVSSRRRMSRELRERAHRVIILEDLDTENLVFKKEN